MSTPSEDNAIAEYTKQIATLAYIYGYAPMTQQTLMGYDLTNRAAMNTMYYSENASSASNQIFSGSNADCLYATAWLDLTNTPIFLTIPETRSQTVWYTIQLIDMYTNTARNIPGIDKKVKTRMYLIIGPDMSIETYENHPNVPYGVKIVQVKTNIAYLVSRIAVLNHDQDFAVTIMRQIKIEPMYTDVTLLNVDEYPSDIFTTPIFFAALLSLIKYNPPPSEESTLINLFKSIGLTPDEEFDTLSQSATVQQALQDAIDVALPEIIPYGYLYGIGNITNNFWLGGSQVGIYGFDYLRRDFVAFGGSAGNVPIEVFYLTSVQDNTGAPLDGSLHKYKMSFASDLSNYPKMHAGGMWSITLYVNVGQLVQGFNLQLYDNEIDKYSVGTNNNDLIFNGDWSLDIYIQNVAPTDPIEYANWLPCPAGSFRLMFRIYSSTVAQIHNPNIPSIIIND
jgi:hypothetical protein